MSGAGKLDRDDVRELIRLYVQEKWSARRVARHFHVGTSTIRYHLIKHGAPWHRREKPPITRTVIPKDEEGVIITVKEQKTGAIRSMHDYGQSAETLAYLAERIDAMQGDWRLIAYSTPRTILGDLQTSKDKGRSKPGYIEAMALSRIGRLDLLDPTLVNGWPSHARRGR